MALVGGRTEHEVLLFSNAGMDLFPSNKPQSFTCKLAIPLELSGLWYVGVKMIQFPCTWLDIQSNFITKIRGDVGDTKTNFEITATVSRGDYTSVTKIIEEINKKLDEEFIKAKAVTGFPTQFNALTSIGSLNLGKDGRVGFTATSPLKNSSIWFAQEDYGINEIGPKLGCDTEDYYSRIKAGAYGPHMSSLTIHDAAISVICPIAEPVLQGNEYVQSLITVPAIGEKGKYIAYHFDAPTFHRVVSDYLSTIPVNLHFDSGAIVQFQAGKTVIDLIFTKNPQRF